LDISVLANLGLKESESVNNKESVSGQEIRSTQRDS
jgi:hypothetical protein